MNHFALILEALRARMRMLEIRELELRDQEGYAGGPEEFWGLSGWDAEAAWPEE